MKGKMGAVVHHCTHGSINSSFVLVYSCAYISLLM